MAWRRTKELLQAANPGRRVSLDTAAVLAGVDWAGKGRHRAGEDAALCRQVLVA